MKSDLFQHEVRKTSSVFGRKEDVTVQFQGEDAMTDGTNIILPAMDFEADISEEDQSIVRGYVDHESGHIRHTDFKALNKLGKEHGKNKLLMTLQNACEDIYLEREVMKEYAGSKDNLIATSKCVNEAFLEGLGEQFEREDLESLTWIAPVAITWEGRKDYGDNYANDCLDLLTTDVRERVKRWTSKIADCKNTKDVIALAKKIEKEIREEEPKGKDKTPPPVHVTEGEGKGKGEGGDGGNCKGKTEKENEGKGEDEGEGEGKGKSTDGDKSKDGDKGERKERFSNEEGGHESSEVVDGEVEEEDNVYEDFDYTTAVKTVKEKNAPEEKDLIRGKSYSALSTAHDRWHHRTDDMNKYGRRSYGWTRLRGGEAQNYDKQLSMMQGDVNMMRRSVERALLAKQQRDWDFGKEDGRLDSRRFPSAFGGKPNVFKLKSERKEMDTALTLLVDLSGSMSGGKVFTAMQCAIALAECVDRSGIAYEILGFNASMTQTPGVPKMETSWSARQCHTRWEIIDMWIFKHFKERLFEAKGAVSSIFQCAGGNNVDGESVEYAYSRLKARQEKRKVMIVLSDGQPACSTDYSASLKKHLERVVKKIEREKDTQVVGIGICSDAVEDYYSQSVVVNSVTDLATSAIGELSQMLLGTKVGTHKRTA